jgi:GntR family transcriptional regulator
MMSSYRVPFRFDPRDRRPLYAQLEEALAARISDGTDRPGAQLPAEDGLVERYGLSRTTVRTAIQNLARRGLVEIRRGTGTFVTEPKMTQELTELSGFVEDMQAQGRHATARVLGRELVPAPVEVARRLEVRTGTRVVRIQRVRLADGVPISLDDTYLPRELGEKIMSDELETQPIFTLLEEKYRTALVEAEYRLEAVTAEPGVAGALGVPVGSAIFLIERTSYGAKRRPVDHEKLYYRGDRVRFVTRLARRAARPKPAPRRR